MFFGNFLLYVIKITIIVNQNVVMCLTNLEKGNGVVKVTWDEYSGIGFILSERIILVHYAPDLSKAFTYDKLKRIKKVGKIYYGSPADGDYRNSFNQIKWRKAINFFNGGDKSVNHQPQIALIKLNRKIDMKSRSNQVIPLSIADYRINHQCVVISLRKDVKNRFVENSVILVSYDECKKKITALSGYVTCVAMSSGRQCDQLSGGDGVICDGKLTGIISDLNKSECNSDLPRICAKISKFRGWIQNTVKELSKYPPKLSSPSFFIKNIAYLEWELKGKSTFNGISIILADNILLTNHGRNPDKEEGQGSAVYGVNGLVKSPTNRLYWNKAINYNNINNPKHEDIQLALLVLKNRIQILQNGIQTEIMPLPQNDSLAAAVCVVVGMNEEEILVQTKASIVSVDECRKQIPKLYDNAICIDLPPESAGVKTHCDLFATGSPLICNDTLAGVVSSSDNCEGEKPRLAASVYKHRQWITSTMKMYNNLSRKRFVRTFHYSFTFLFFTNLKYLNAYS